MKAKIWRLPNGIWALRMPYQNYYMEYTSWEFTIKMFNIFRNSW